MISAFFSFSVSTPKQKLRCNTLKTDLPWASSEALTVTFLSQQRDVHLPVVS